MHTRILTLIAAAAVLVSFWVEPLVAQSGTRPDLSGIYVSLPPNGFQFGEDLTSKLLPGEELILTPYGAERYRNVDIGPGDPGAQCLPPGPIRGLWGLPQPIAIVQSAGLIVIALEFSGTYRIIYTDGREHPEATYEIPQFMGHSIGTWEGDTLVVDTVAVDERVWIDPHAFEHSDQLHLVERFQKTGPTTIRWTLTVEDPVFFVKPFTVGRSFELRRDELLLPYWCSENEKDLEHMQPIIGGIGRPKMMDENGNITQFEPTNRP